MYVTVHNYDTPEGVERCDELAVEFVREKLEGFRLGTVETTEGKVLASLLPGPREVQAEP